ncbi:uncharacterized protein J3D65DRAFT_641690 [Phyllosticta citribraziliensis]|uniref:Uncharacterized protein n=1 Tax=Phyllosticta citribraziliensis TaxID=989973 RepID=A0ABR1L3X0_9PEZI
MACCSSRSSPLCTLLSAVASLVIILGEPYESCVDDFVVNLLHGSGCINLRDDEVSRFLDFKVIHWESFRKLELRSALCLLQPVCHVQWLVDEDAEIAESGTGGLPIGVAVLHDTQDEQVVEYSRSIHWRSAIGQAHERDNILTDEDRRSLEFLHVLSPFFASILCLHSWPVVRGRWRTAVQRSLWAYHRYNPKLGLSQIELGEEAQRLSRRQ